jgi:rRNA-processing protein FCF1
MPVTVFRKHGPPVTETRHFILGYEVKESWFQRMEFIWKEHRFPDETLTEYVDRNKESILRTMNVLSSDGFKKRND